MLHPPFPSIHLIPPLLLIPPPQSSPSSPLNPNQHRSSEPSVAFSGGTGMIGNVASPSNLSPSTSHSISPPSPSASQNPFNIPPPLSETFFNQSPPRSSTADNHDPPSGAPSSGNNDCDPFQERWSSAFPVNISWEDFSNQCNKFSEDVIKTSNERQPGRKSGGPRAPIAC